MANGSYVGSGAYLNVDMSDLQRTIDLLRGIMTKTQFEQLIRRTFNEVGKKSRTLISSQIPRQYRVTKKWVAPHIGSAKIEIGGFSRVTCTIPLSGHKGSIGGTFYATGGYNNRRIKARIIRGPMTTLPLTMKNQGGNPPFINPKSAKLNGVAFTRRGKDRLPIVKVVGLGAPQMPLNRSADAVQDSLLEYAGQRLERNFLYMFGKGG
jgi:hypothetical protein